MTIRSTTRFFYILPSMLGGLLFLSGSPGWAQPVSPQLHSLLEHPPQKTSDPHHKPVILLRERRMTIDQDGLSQETLHIIGRILTEQIKKDYRQIIVPYNSYYEDVRLTFARTVSPQGQIVDVRPDAVQRKTDPTITGYSDTRWLTFSLRGLDVGSYFEYQVQIIQTQALIPGQWYGYYKFHYLKMGTPPRLDPVAHSRFILTIPQDHHFDYRLTRLDLTPTIHTQRHSTTYTWEAYDLPAVPLESSMPPWSDLTPDLAFSSVRSWEAIDAWGDAHFRTPLTLTPEIQAHVQALTNDLPTSEEKIAALYHFVQSDIEYLFANLGSGGYTPHAPQEILTSRYGDCKDQVTLLLTMLKALDIPAYPALIRPAPYSQVVKDIPSLYFPHLITYIPRDTGDLWLDTTSPVTPFPHLPIANQDRWAFVINGHGGEFRKTPLASPDANHGTILIHFHPTEGNLHAQLTLTGTGALHDRLKTSWHQSSPHAPRRSLRRFVKLIYRHAHIHSANMSGLDHPSTPLSGQAAFVLQNTWNPKTDFLTFRDDGLGALYYFASYLRHLPAPEDRHQDFLLFEPLHLTYKVSYTLPTKEYRTPFVLLPHTLDTPSLSFTKLFSRINQTFQVQCDLILKPPTITAKDYAQFYESLEKVFAHSAWEVTFTTRGKEN